ncbi:MAG: signal peptidase II [Elusimicrobiales bacterium]|nr:signal peptidase II [Elusimicrobiales bacterium]
MLLKKMLNIFNDRRLLGTLIVVFVFLIDVISKNYVIKNPSLWFKSYLCNFINIHIIENTGVAFGMFKGHNDFFIVFNSIILLFLFYFKRNIRSNISFYGIHFIIGGAIGNIFDRIKYGFVIDFIDLRFFPAIFNFADFFITVGIFMLVVDEFFLKKGGLGEK